MNLSEFSFHIFDHGAQYIDRFTLVSPDGNVYSFSDDPYHPNGVGQFSHSCNGEHSEYTWEGKRLYVEEMKEECVEISLNDLPTTGAKKFVGEKIKDEFWYCTDPDAGQFCKIEPSENDGGENTYHYAQWAGDSVPVDVNEMREKIGDDFFWHRKSIKYSEIENPECEISGYCDSLDVLKKAYPDDWRQIVCECCFENSLPALLLLNEQYESGFEDMEDRLNENAYHGSLNKKNEDEPIF